MNSIEPEPPQRWSPARITAIWVLFMFAVSRLVLLALTFYSRRIVERGPLVILSGQTAHGGTLLDVMTQWDGVWYRSIAQHGYFPPSHELAPAFFPGYPMLIRAVAFVVRDSDIASLLVSNGCLIAAAFLLVRLLRLDYDENVCRRVVTFLMFNPVSFFLSAAYSESTFLLLSIGALLAVREGKWLVAGLCGTYLSATRPPGLLIGAPLLAEYVIGWRERGLKARNFFRPHFLSLFLIPLGLVAYLFYMQAARGDFFLPMHAQSAWKKTLTSPWQTFFWPGYFPSSHIPLYQAVVGAAVVLVGAGFFFRVRVSYLVYAVASILFYLAWGTLEAVPRYVSILFPIHLVLALISVRWKWTYEPLLAFSIALLALCTVLFANAYQMF
ncbi:MAG: hypothetical protein QOH88_2641 [Verrucomicrobiota bacterium]|jgi:hypothetical protein